MNLNMFKGEDMSANSKRWIESTTEIPEEFDFGIEQRSDSDEKKGRGGTHPRKITAHAIFSDCTHEWAPVATGEQTLRDEGKKIWKCRQCGEITHTYSWEKPE